MTSRSSSFLINLSSALVSASASDFTTYFPTSISLPGNSEGRLVSLAVWNTQKNVSDQFNNRKFRFTADAGANWTEGTLQSGAYAAGDLISAINTIMDQSGVVVDPTNPVGFRTLSTCIRLTISEPTLGFKVFFFSQSPPTQQYALDLTNNGTSDLYKIFGSANRAYGTVTGPPVISDLTNVEIFFPQIADVSNGVTAYNVLCDIASSSTTAGQPGQTIFSFVPDNVPPGALFNLIPPYPIPFHINQRSINSIRIQILDNLNRRVELQDGIPAGTYSTNATQLAILITSGA
jgi:hypothetical protein